jgi:hypothetical protein
MKILVIILVVLVLVMGTFKLLDYWDKVSQEKENAVKVQDGSDIKEYELGGLPYQLEQTYQQAKAKGASGMKDFLKKYGEAPKFQDPRKAWIQLDYVVMIAGSEPTEAKKIFLDVKSRIRTNAPIYRRIRAMSKTFE